MLLTANRPVTLPCSVASQQMDETDWDTASPFGLQGLLRDTLTVLKPDCVGRLAITLAAVGTRQQIQDEQFVQQILTRHSEWIDEYRVVHLIEKSLWINGRSDLVMTLLRNPSQIPDNPPPAILQALSRANELHPDAVVWYGVPVFGDEETAEGLPIPLTASQVREEARKRIAAAQRHALQWGWLYRTALQVASVPGICRRIGRRLKQRGQRGWERLQRYFQRARNDARRRSKATIQRQLELTRAGWSNTLVPAHTTLLGRSLEFGREVAGFTQELVENHAPMMGLALTPVAFSTLVPMLIVPITIASADPFLFVELPDEPGQLRHLGHWYWQEQQRGRKRLHLHA